MSDAWLGEPRELGTLRHMWSDRTGRLLKTIGCQAERAASYFQSFSKGLANRGAWSLHLTSLEGLSVEEDCTGQAFQFYNRTHG